MVQGTRSRTARAELRTPPRGIVCGAELRWVEELAGKPAGPGPTGDRQWQRYVYGDPEYRARHKQKDDLDG